MPRAAKSDLVNGSYSPESCESGFLTKAQQELLDAAVLEKQKSGVLLI